MRSLQPSRNAKVAEIPPTLMMDLIQQEMEERRLYRFVRAAWSIIEPGNPYIDSWHVGCVCEHLQAMTDLEITRLIINMPRRRGKTNLASILWFSWAWIKQPWSRWNFYSYGEKLALDASIKCRRLIMSPWYQDRWGDRFNFSQDQNAKMHFTNNHGGRRLASSIQGGILGFGGEYNIADDIHNLIDSYSPARLAQAVELWTSGVMMSVNDPKRTRFLVVMQRLAQGDLSGHLRDNDLGYECLVLPEWYEPTRVFFDAASAKECPKERDPIILTSIQRSRPVVQNGKMVIRVRDPRTKDGELLCPERYPQEVVDAEKKALRPYGSASQQQQRPSPLEGTIFQETMFRYFRLEQRGNRPGFLLLDRFSGKDRWVSLDDCRFFQTIDTASKDGETNDYTVVGTWALTPHGDLLLYDIWRYRIIVPFQFPAMQHLRHGACLWVEESQTFVPLAPWPRPLLFQAVEDASSGIGLIQSAQAAGMPFRPLHADRNPMERVGPISNAYYSGKVYHLEGANWLHEYESELLGFNHATHDDCVMVAAYAGYLMLHDVILKSHLGRELFVSDKATAQAASAIDRRRSDGLAVKINIPGAGDMTVDFDD